MYITSIRAIFEMYAGSIFIHDEVKSHYSIILSLISDVTELLLRYSLPVIISISMRYKEREREEKDLMTFPYLSRGHLYVYGRLALKKYQ